MIILKIKKTILISSAIFIIAALVLAAMFYEFVQTPINPGIGPVTVQIPRGLDFSGISDILEREGLVSRKNLFYLLVRLEGAGRRIRAGEYELTGAMTPRELVDALKKGAVKEYRVSVPEGFTVSQIAARLAAGGLADASLFQARARDRDLLSSLGIPIESAEGYLFPDTYVITKSMDESEIVSFMVNRFKKEISQRALDRAAELGFTLHEIVTLASMIEKESAVEEEKPLIAAVFHNRLKKGMKLQSDPTVIYAIEDFDGNITRKDLKRHTPYNTYVIRGLPPGPICNPGASSIVAALHPSNVDYLYFVSKNDGSHQFSSNLSSHGKAVIKYQIKRQK